MSVVFFLSRKSKQTRPCKPGFTLAELLITLGILGVIAAFTIPKILTSQQNQQYNAIANDSAAMVSAAYQQYQASNTVTSGFGIQDLTPYMNYVSYNMSAIRRLAR